MEHVSSIICNAIPLPGPNGDLTEAELQRHLEERCQMEVNGPNRELILRFGQSLAARYRLADWSENLCRREWRQFQLRANRDKSGAAKSNAAAAAR